MYSKKLKSIMERTNEKALSCRVEEFSLEMVVSEILKDREVNEILKRNSISTENLERDFQLASDEYVQENASLVAPSESNADLNVAEVMSRATLDIKKYKNEDEDEFESSASELCIFDVLAAIFMAEKSQAYKILSSYGIRRGMFTEQMNHLKKKSPSESTSINFSEDEKDELPKDILTSMNEAYIEGKMQPMIGRTSEIDNIATILARKTKNNPIVTGKPGVGKTAIIEGLAARIVEGEVPDALKDKEVFNLNLGALLAGTKYRGDFETRVMGIIKKMKSPNAIVFIDEIHTILGAGSSGNNVDMSNLLKPYLTSGELTIVGATTDDEYVQIFEKNGALSRRFNEVKVKELSREDTISLLYGISSNFSEYHGVKYGKSVMEEIVSLSDRYLASAQFPDKAIDILDQTSAVVRTRPNTTNEVTVEDVLSVISRRTGVPVDSMQDQETNKAVINLQERLNANVFGQEKAIEQVSESMLLSYAGLKQTNKPIGSFLCIGPTGVGKTELAKTLSNELTMPLVRFDMSEYMEPHSISKLIGSPAGYVGHDEGSMLYKAMRANPYSVVLFDEFEKAHPKINNIFLQILDEGVVSDAQGNVIDFKNSIIIFTSNAGVKTTASELRSIGFGADHSQESGIDMERIKTTFPPEFRNRLSSVLEFNSLTKESISFIANKAIKSVAERLKENKGINIIFKEEVAEMVGLLGFDAAMGARPIERKVEELISKQLAKKILVDNIGEGDKIAITKKKGKDELLFRVTRTKK